MPGPGKKEVRRPAANGRWPIPNETVAADWTRHAKGTILLIEDYGFREVTDKGGRIKKLRLDMFKKNCAVAVNFGVQKKLVIEVPGL